MAAPLPSPGQGWVGRPRASPRGLHARRGSANRLRITNRAHNPARGATSPGGRLPIPVFQTKTTSGILVIVDARVARAGAQQRPFALESLLHASRRGPLARGAARDMPDPSPSSEQRPPKALARRRGCTGVAREPARGNWRRRGRCSAAGSTGGSAVGSEVDYGSRLLHVGSACRAAPAVLGQRTRRVGR